jgi:hypothetical protein
MAKTKNKSTRKTKKNRRGNPRIIEVGKHTRFAPGQSGNPGGRPACASFSEAIRQIAGLTVKQLRNSKSDSVATGVAKALTRQALRGRVSAIGELVDRAEGKARQTVDTLHTQPATIHVEYEDPSKSANFIESIRQIYGVSAPRDSPSGPAKPPELADVLMQIAQQTDEKDEETLQAIATLAVLLQSKKGIGCGEKQKTNVA